jgi:hypothetical protein
MTSSNKTIAKIAGLMAVAFALIAAGLFLITRDDSPASKLLRQGNDAFAQQAYLDALGAYELAQARQPELAEPFYNAANALYREGSFGDAVAQIQQALLNVEDEELAQHSFFNLGNAAYNGQDLETAVQSYIDALLINPNDTDAKYNLELALQQQQQQQQQQEQEQQEQESEQSEDSESEDSESQDGQEGEENQDQQESNSENGENEQESESGEGDQESEESKDGQGEESNEQSDQEQDQNDPSQNGEGEQDEQEQEQANQGNGQPQPGDPNDPNQNGMVPQPGERMTKEQARQLLMSIAQGSGTLQERLQQIYVSPLPPSAQDW